MIRRGSFLLTAASALVLVACKPPCNKVARLVCDIPSEGDACSYLLDKDSKDADAQDLCKEILPQAHALSENRDSTTAMMIWQGAREKLIRAGMVADPTHGNIDEKLIRANGVAGHIVQDLHVNMQAGEQHVNESAQQAVNGSGN